MHSLIDVANDPTTCGKDRAELHAAIADALQQARAVRGLLARTIVPALAFEGRALADRLVRTLDRGDFFDEATLGDIGTVLSLLQRQIDVGTYVGWEADEHHVRGGYERIELDHRARRLVPALAGLTKLRAAIATARGLAHALSVAQDTKSH